MSSLIIGLTVWCIVSIGRFFGGHQSFLICLGTPGGGRSDSPIAFEWRHGARIHPGDGFAGALFPITPTLWPTATMATPRTSQPKGGVVG